MLIIKKLFRYVMCMFVCPMQFNNRSTLSTTWRLPIPFDIQKKRRLQSEHFSFHSGFAFISRYWTFAIFNLKWRPQNQNTYRNRLKNPFNIGEKSLQSGSVFFHVLLFIVVSWENCVIKLKGDLKYIDYSRWSRANSFLLSCHYRTALVCFCVCNKYINFSHVTDKVLRGQTRGAEWFFFFYQTNKQHIINT